MPNQNQKARDTRGMSTTEVVELTGLPRSKLLIYVDRGIVAPTRASSSDQSELRWTFEQAWMASVVPDLLVSGLTLKEIAELAEKGTEAVLKQLEEQYVAELRAARRGRKSAVYRMRELADTCEVQSVDGDYVRYIPQRYLALAPIPDAQGPVPGPGHNRYIVDLMNIAASLGWCCTSSFGFLSSVSADGQDSSFYAFNLLGSPPMPAFSGTKAVDGGCYRVASKCPGEWPCKSADCRLCTRHGREPSQASLFDWEGAKTRKPELWDNTVMAGDLAELYPTGIWSEYTKQLLGDESSNDREGKSATVRPRKMPQELRLPLGITACVMPAGVYLCHQCVEENRDKAFARVLGLASFLQQREFSLEDELRASADSSRGPSLHGEYREGPVPDPFATVHIEGDPKMAGWWRRITNDVARELVVPTNMALAPENGYIVTCAALPVANRNDTPRYEIELLVDASKLTPHYSLSRS